MPLSYHLDADRQLITISGEYAEAAEWRELLARIAADPGHRPGLSILRDLRGATKPIGPVRVVSLMEVVRQFWPRLQPHRAAILTPMLFDPAALVAHALADTHQLPVRLFNSLDLALEWLDTGRAAAGP